MTRIASIKKAVTENSGVAVLVSVAVFFQLFLTLTGRGDLFNPVNIYAIIRQNAYIAILSVGMLILLLAGGNIDFSISATVGMLSALVAVLMNRMDFSTPLAIAVMVAAGVLLGAWNGFWIAIMRIPSFIVTIVGMFIIRSISLVLLHGINIAMIPNEKIRFLQFHFPSYGDSMIACVAVGVLFSFFYILISISGRLSRRKFGDSVFMGSTASFAIKMLAVSAFAIYFCYTLGLVRGFSFMFIFVAIIVLFYSFCIQHTVAGRYLYAMGGNERAARFAGINTAKVLFFSYVNMGFLAALTTIISIGRFNSTLTADEPLINTLGACFLGGVSAYGGRGKVSGVVAGAASMAFINNGMAMMGIHGNWLHIVQGLIVLFVLALNITLNRKDSDRQV